MKNTPYRCKNAFYIIIVVLAGCTMPISSSPSSTAANPDYTAAAQTIAAQLTEIAGPGYAVTNVLLTMGVFSSPNAGTATETLPNTSTPLPTKTPLPSNTPTITLTGTATPIPSNTPIPTTTLDEPKAGLGEPDFNDTFVDGANWFIYNDEQVAMEVQDSHLKMTALNADKYEAMMLSTLPILEDFYMEVTAKTGDCSGLDRYGLIVRAPGFTPIQGYLFGFSCDGRYSFRTFDGVSFAAILQWTPSELIQIGPNQTNTLGFYASGQQIKLYANGKLLAELQDSRFTSGYFGLFAGAYTTPGFSVNISRVAYWELP